LEPRFFLAFYSRDGVPRRQLHPLANVWIRAAAPLQYYRQPNRAGFDLAIRRLESWGSNTIGNWSDSRLMGCAQEGLRGEPARVGAGRLLMRNWTVPCRA
jgi:hypothetical protein